MTIPLTSEFHAMSGNEIRNSVLQFSTARVHRTDFPACSREERPELRTWSDSSNPLLIAFA